jgi:O-antigen ligase
VTKTYSTLRHGETRLLRSPNTRAAALGFGIITLSGVDDGGYFQRTWGWLALALAAVAGLTLLRDRVVGPLELAMLASLTALTAWTLVSGLWGIPGTSAGREAERAFLYLVALVVLMHVVESESVAALLAGVVSGVSVLVSYGLLDRFLRGEVDPFEGTLLVEPVGYANALGLLAAISLILSLGLAASAGRGRTLLLLASCLMVVALFLTESRGAWLALACGLLVLALFHLGRWRVMTRRRLRSASVVAGAAVAVALTSVAVLSPRSALGDRLEYWDAALEDANDHRLLGSGAGSFDVYWHEYGNPSIHVRDAHSLYLETLAELGVLGLALVLVLVAIPFFALLRDDGPIVAAAGGGFTAFVVHAGIDWDWEMPVVTLTGITCAVALLVPARQRRPIVVSDRARGVALGIALAGCAVAAALAIR